MISPSRALLLLDGERQARGQQVGQPARLPRIDRGDLELLRDLLALVDHPLEEPVHVVHQRVELDPFLDDLLVRLDLADEIGLGLHDADQPRPILALADDPRGAVGEFQHLQDQPDADRREQVVHPGRVRLRMQLADQRDHAFADHRVVDQPDAARPVDDQRHHRLRERRHRTATAAGGRGKSPSPGSPAGRPAR